MLLETGSFSFSFGIDPHLIPMVCIPGLAYSSSEGVSVGVHSTSNQPGFLWREAWSHGYKAVGSVSTFLGLEAWSSSCGAELGVPLTAAQAQLLV